MDITVPDIGHFIDVPVIEVHVTAGDIVAAEDQVITLGSEKATLDVPASAAGTVGEVALRVGDGTTENEARAVGVTTARESSPGPPAAAHSSSAAPTE